MSAATPITLGGFLLEGAHDDGSFWTVDRSKLDGWDGTGTTLEVTQRPAGHGGWGSPAYLTSRTLSIGGRVAAPEPVLWRQYAALAAAVSLEDTELVVPEPGGDVKSMLVRRQGKPLLRPLGPTLAEYSISVVALDPRKLGEPVVRTTALPATSGGRTYPYVYPYTYASTMVSGIVTIDNPGKLDGPVLVRFDGPVTAPAVTHIGPSGVEHRYASSLVLPAGAWLEVECDQHLSLENGQAPRDTWITSREWPVLEVGLNVFAFSAGLYDPAARMTVTARPAWE